jgi:hypothetical protein
MRSVQKMEKNKALIGDILVEFCMIEQCIKSIVFDVYGTVSDRNNRKTFDDFYYHIDHRVNGRCKSSDKIFKDKNDDDISLVKLLKEICSIRHIAAHQTDALVVGWSSAPANEILMKRTTQSRKMERKRLENTILFEDDYKVIITHGRGRASLHGGSYTGSAEDLHKDWEFYRNQFNKIYEIWNGHCFEVFDIDGAQIAEN